MERQVLFFAPRSTSKSTRDPELEKRNPYILSRAGLTSHYRHPGGILKLKIKAFAKEGQGVRVGQVSTFTPLLC